MKLQLFWTVFATVFVAELGDKTQLATLLYAAKDENPKLTIFVASAAALTLSAAIGVAAGSVVAQYVSPRLLGFVAGAGFVAIGVWTIFSAAVAPR